MEHAQFLREDDLARCSPRPSQGGQVMRAFCPFHGSDHQRSLRVTSETGRFQCFSCGVWGYLEGATRGGFNTPLPLPRQRLFQAPPVRTPSMLPVALRERTRTGLPVLIERYWQYLTALPDSPGAAYLRERGIPLELAQRRGVGYCPPGRWLNPSRDWKDGRLVFPHTTRGGDVVNLYGRAVGSDVIPRSLRHDHLPGAKAYFNGRALVSQGPLYICEGAFDALALLAAGIEHAVAIFGIGDWRWELARETSTIVIALDGDGPGQKQAESLAREGARLGKKVLCLEPCDYGGHKDPAAAWRAGTLRLPENSVAMT